MGCKSLSIRTELEDSKKVFDLYRSKGGNFYDTANAYTNGQSEEFLGQFLSSIRSEAVIATKYTAHPKFHPSNPKTDFVSPNGGGNSRKSMVENLDQSLKRLGTGYVDILYVHNWDAITPIEETMRGLDDVIRSGKALYVAISDAPAWVVAQANTTAHFRGWSKFIGLQTRYNLCDRSLEFDIGSMARSHNISILAWGCLAEGFLTGKHQKDQKLEESGRNEWVVNHFQLEQNLKILEEVKAIANETGKSPAQVSLNWIAQRPVIPIFGARTEAQLRDNLEALEFTLTPEQMSRLNKVSEPTPSFPFNWRNRFPYFNGGGTRVKPSKNIWFD